MHALRANAAAHSGGVHAARTPLPAHWPWPPLLPCGRQDGPASRRHDPEDPEAKRSLLVQPIDPSVGIFQSCLNGSLVPGCAYVAASSCMILFNKHALSSFNFQCPSTLLLVHCLLAVLLVRGLGAAGWHVEHLRWNIVRVWLPVNLLFVGMIVSGFFALKLVGVGEWRMGWQAANRGAARALPPLLACCMAPPRPLMRPQPARRHVHGAEEPQQPDHHGGRLPAVWEALRDGRVGVRGPDDPVRGRGGHDGRQLFVGGLHVADRELHLHERVRAPAACARGHCGV